MGFRRLSTAEDLARSGKQFDDVAVDVADENLHRAIRAADGAANFEALCCEVILPGLEVIRSQGEVIAAIMGNDGLVAFADEVQFLDFAETKPGTRECKGGPG